MHIVLLRVYNPPPLQLMLGALVLTRKHSERGPDVWRSDWGRKTEEVGADWPVSGWGQGYYFW